MAADMLVMSMLLGLTGMAKSIAVLNGIGSEYFPKLDLLKRYKKLIFVENESDKRILSILGEKCGMPMPNDVVFWATTDSHADRRRLFEELYKAIPGLRCVSLRDRDMDNPDVVGEGLTYKSIQLPQMRFSSSTSMAILAPVPSLK